MKGQFTSGVLYLLMGALLATSVVSCGKKGKSRFFEDQAYHFQTLRAMSDVQAYGADIGEILQTIDHIEEGNAESWFNAWHTTAEGLVSKTKGMANNKSRGRVLLRAHNYFRTAEFFLSPDDPRRLPTFDQGVNVFFQGLDSLSIRYQKIKIPYGEHHLNAVYYPGPEGSQSKPLIVAVGGFDSTLEELYFVIVKEAHDRGYNVLTYEGPGQGSVLRHQNLGFTPEWEKPTRAVLDTFISQHAKPKKIILLGMSLGGYLAPRAAAFDKRIDAVVAYDVLFDFGAIAEAQVPGFVLWLNEKEMHSAMNILVNIKAAFSPGFAWGVSNGQWVMHTSSAPETLAAFKHYNLSEVAPLIQQDVLILAGTEDHFIPIQQAYDFEKSLVNAKSVKKIIYDRASGGSEHCQLGAQTLWHADFFDWMKQIE